MPQQIQSAVDQAVYTDFRTDFLVHPVTGDLVLVLDEDDVSQSLENLVKTNFYEVPFSPLLGSNITSQMFELPSTLVQTITAEDVRTLIANHEPRANLIDVQVQDYPDLYGLAVTITYSLVNSGEAVVLSVFLERVR
jgi:phage baseplate assembly protein W